jgi:hypothetical protein
VPASPLFVFEHARHERVARRVLRGLPPLSGGPIRIQQAPRIRDRHGPVHAGSFLRGRRIAFSCTAAEFPRIFVHELFHFVWLRAGNPLRLAYEKLIRAEIETGARGELGWSAEWRKRELEARDLRLRTRRWREYCCESFCDTAAWHYSGITGHSEFTLAGNHRWSRRKWLLQAVKGRLLWL